MIYNDLYRQFLLGSTICVFILFAMWALFKPYLLADSLGYSLKNKNGLSEFHAIYIGVFLAQSILCGYAIWQIHNAVIGDLVAVFLLAPAIARFAATAREGAPNGFMLVLFILEAVAGLTLLAVRPSL